MKIISTIALLMLFVMIQPVSAEFYRYVDPHGNVIFTDDLSKVPPDQREQVKSYEESKYRPPKAPEKTDEQKKTPQDAGEDEQYNRLRRQEETLEQERNALKAERERLNQEGKEAVTPEQIKEYNRSIVDFNARIKAYEEKRDVYAAEVEKYQAEREARKEAKPKE
jgi:chromosome segregation ATPase